MQKILHALKKTNKTQQNNQTNQNRIVIVCKNGTRKF